ncbi:hypothetical protein [Bacteroides pyogenes]|uniref:hypothetical protein n=1 Tax=Bacteroides pyogenes TaxID=310300 RepID=UPI001D834912|nr:hypothetical protein [Bacteroides pyogenes]MBR8707507.1 hypothetical protein [Bacteroides pyogenes]MBR8716297.1 hypothetical protein [Bacteroides pyogenes]MBR8745767.1 hypothetical protein [Bacteroides pyogenes]MBR8779377.1 hypothetical protein [Bacteroides pyogenes]MCI7070539.1 hypothetical protein [Bacteroides pyogenes]
MFRKRYKDRDNCKGQLKLDLDLLPENQTGTVRYKIPQVAYVVCYLVGVEDVYKYKI